MLNAYLTALPVQNLNDQSMWSIIIGAGIVVKCVMLTLLVFSIICWGIILTKAITLSRAKKHTQLFFDAFRESRKFSTLYTEAKQFTHSPLAHVFRTGCTELSRLSRIQAGSQKGSVTLMVSRNTSEQVWTILYVHYSKRLRLRGPGSREG